MNIYRCKQNNNDNVDALYIHFTVWGRITVSPGCKLNAMLCIKKTGRELGHIKREYMIHILLYNGYNKMSL
jgi:hypothetical protein